MPVKRIGKVAAVIGLVLSVMLILALSMCRGPYLGQYRFENARLVDSSVLARVAPSHLAVEPGATFIRIEFTSDQDLEVAAGDEQLYVHADFCPGHDEYRLFVIGPYYNDRSRYGRTPEIEHRVPDTRNRIAAGYDDGSHPIRNPGTGRYVYTAYIEPSAPAAQFSAPYDLRQGVRDLCLWIDHPGYYLSRSQSGVFVIPGAAIAAALRQAPATH